MKDSDDNSGELSGTPLTKMSCVSESDCKALAAQWINTAEELIATAATDTGRSGLCAVLSCDAVALEKLLDAVAQKLPPERVALLRQPAKVRTTGLLVDDASKTPKRLVDEEGER